MKIGKGTEKKEEKKAFPHFTDVRFWKSLDCLPFDVVMKKVLRKY